MSGSGCWESARSLARKGAGEEPSVFWAAAAADAADEFKAGTYFGDIVLTVTDPVHVLWLDARSASSTDRRSRPPSVNTNSSIARPTGSNVPSG
jgi:hypothetical protein